MSRGMQSIRLLGRSLRRPLREPSPPMRHRRRLDIVGRSLRLLQEKARLMGDQVIGQEQKKCPLINGQASLNR
jgi:hypothetical protein